MFDMLKRRMTQCSSSRKKLKKASPSTMSTWRKSTIIRHWTTWVCTPADLRFITKTHIWKKIMGLS